VILFYGSEDDVRTVTKHPLASIGSDGRAISPKAGGKPHPRYYGTFPRVLGKYVREEKLLTLEEAVRKMTSLPAAAFGIQDRGVLREGLAADITVFDPDKIIDKATYDNPHQYPEGISYVIVNGEVVVENGKHTGIRSGKVLKRR
jgi:N-acyl-D-aspartate/D-glutamate deacylase